MVIGVEIGVVFLSLVIIGVGIVVVAMDVSMGVTVDVLMDADVLVEELFLSSIGMGFG
jgi:hypothetical protein